MLDWVKGIINKGMEWIDRLFGNFEGYSSSYSQLLVYGLLIFLVSKMLKIKIDVTNKPAKK
jgi:hypothetical protein